MSSSQANFKRLDILPCLWSSIIPMRKTPVHYIMSLMMIFVMLAAVLMSGFHHHDGADDHAAEVACDICLTLDHVQVGAVPVALAWVAVVAISISALLLKPIVPPSLVLYSIQHPRAPPLV